MSYAQAEGTVKTAPKQKRPPGKGRLLLNQRRVRSNGIADYYLTTVIAAPEICPMCAHPQAYFAADYIPKAEYLSGILLEPIAKYFAKVCDSLKQLLNEPTKTEFLAAPQESASPAGIQEKGPVE